MVDFSVLLLPDLFRLESGCGSTDQVVSCIRTFDQEPGLDMDAVYN